MEKFSTIEDLDEKKDKEEVHERQNKKIEKQDPEIVVTAARVGQEMENDRYRSQY